MQATTGVSLPATCQGPRAGFEGFAFYGTVDGGEIDLTVSAEIAPYVRRLTGFENESCSLQTCQIIP